MVNEFSRTEMSIGAEGMNTPENPTVAIFGVGGAGSHVMEALARCDMGRLIPVDNNVVSLTNINWQSIALHSAIGQFKTRIMKERIVDICPGTQVTTFEEFMLPDNIESFFKHMELQMGQGNSVDCILDAIDIVTAKLALADFVVSYGIPVTAFMGTGNKFHPELLWIPDISRTSMCPFHKAIREESKAKNISGLKVCWSPGQLFMPGQTAEDTGYHRVAPGSISFVPPVAGLMIAGAVVRGICGLE